MEMKIQVKTKEIIKPSSPTGENLKTHKLTILDQLTMNVHIPLLLFYSSTPDSIETSHHLKKSLKETLTHFYPLAGRPLDNSYIDCNDSGATYIETCVDGNLNEVLEEPTYVKLEQLLPINPTENLIGLGVPEILLVQVNYFSCGGVAIGICTNHVIADASTVGTFVKCWGAMARGDGVEVDGVITDCTSIFPPVDPRNFWFSTANELANKDVLLNGCVSNRFVFSAPKITALKEKIGSMKSLPDLPTRFEAVASLILGVLMSITEEKSDNHEANVLVDLRRRINPPLPPQSIGNIVQSTKVKCLSNQNEIDYNHLARKIRDTVREINDENLRKYHKSGQILNDLKMAIPEKGIATAGVASFSSWRFPYYEADFGWGKPTWVATTVTYNSATAFLDSRDGEGIEVWLGLTKELMSQFEQHPDVIAYCSFIAFK